MREAVSRILQAECDLLGHVDHGSAVLAAAKKHRPDAIVLDISLPGMSGMALLPMLRSLLPGTVIVMLTNHASAEYIEEAFRRGADGYVLKNDAHRDLLPALRQGRTSAAETYAYPVAATLPLR